MADYDPSDPTVVLNFLENKGFSADMLARVKSTQINTTAGSGDHTHSKTRPRIHERSRPKKSFDNRTRPNFEQPRFVSQQEESIQSLLGKYKHEGSVTRSPYKSPKSKIPVLRNGRGGRRRGGGRGGERGRSPRLQPSASMPALPPQHPGNFRHNPNQHALPRSHSSKHLQQHPAHPEGHAPLIYDNPPDQYDPYNTLLGEQSRQNAQLYAAMSQVLGPGRHEVLNSEIGDIVNRFNNIERPENHSPSSRLQLDAQSYERLRSLLKPTVAGAEASVQAGYGAGIGGSAQRSGNTPRLLPRMEGESPAMGAHTSSSPSLRPASANRKPQRLEPVEKSYEALAQDAKDLANSGGVNQQNESKEGDSTDGQSLRSLADSILELNFQSQVPKNNFDGDGWAEDMDDTLLLTPDFTGATNEALKKSKWDVANYIIRALGDKALNYFPAAENAKKQALVAASGMEEKAPGEYEEKTADQEHNAQQSFNADPAVMFVSNYNPELEELEVPNLPIEIRNQLVDDILTAEQRPALTPDLSHINMNPCEFEFVPTYPSMYILHAEDKEWAGLIPDKRPEPTPAERSSFVMKRYRSVEVKQSSQQLRAVASSLVLPRTSTVVLKMDGTESKSNWDSRVPDKHAHLPPEAVEDTIGPVEREPHPEEDDTVGGTDGVPAITDGKETGDNVGASGPEGQTNQIINVQNILNNSEDLTNKQLLALILAQQQNNNQDALLAKLVDLLDQRRHGHGRRTPSIHDDYSDDGYHREGHSPRRDPRQFRDEEYERERKGYDPYTTHGTAHADLRHYDENERGHNRQGINPAHPPESLSTQEPYQNDGHHGKFSKSNQRNKPNSMAMPDIIEERADVSEPSEEEPDDGVSNAQKQALFTKCRNNRYHQVEQMFAAGIPVDVTDKHSNQCLHIACQNGNKRMVKVCLRWGANINCQNMQGQTPLHYAFAYNYDEVVAYLIKKGADDTMVNFFGYSCYDGLRPDDRESAVRLLREHLNAEVSDAMIVDIMGEGFK